MLALAIVKEDTIKTDKLEDLINSKIHSRSDINQDDLRRVKANFNRSKHGATASGFQSAAELTVWYLDQFIKQDGKCCYCETPISLLRKLIDANLLRTRTVGRTGKGRRGYRLEIERLDTEENIYKPENCMLSCYYCNNDKSYIFPMDDYKKFLAPSRRQYFEFLASKI